MGKPSMILGGLRTCRLAAGLCGFFTAAALAQAPAPATSAAGTCVGSYELVGAHMGCRAFDETPISISLIQCGFSDVPTFTAYGRHEGPDEHVYLRLMGVDKMSATVRVTTASRDSHQVCGRTTVEWEAHQ
jgi:hypothetical protein